MLAIISDYKIFKTKLGLVLITEALHLSLSHGPAGKVELSSLHPGSCQPSGVAGVGLCMGHVPGENRELLEHRVLLSKLKSP